MRPSGILLQDTENFSKDFKWQTGIFSIFDVV